MPDSFYHHPTHFDDYAAELAGQSRDRVIRPTIEKMVRSFFHTNEKEGLGLDSIMPFFSDNPTIIYGLSEPGWVWTGWEDTKRCFADEHEKKKRTVPKTIVVDRGRVTCYVVTFEFETIDFDSFTEIQRIVIFDLNKNNRIQRLEYRDIADTTKQRKGGREVLDALITEIEEGAMAVDYLC